jgi:excisionase family DNA binding protein
VGGSNRLLSVDELAAYLGVPKKTVYGCWRQWGLRGYRVGGELAVVQGEPGAFLKFVHPPILYDFTVGRSPITTAVVPHRGN